MHFHKFCIFIYENKNNLKCQMGYLSDAHTKEWKKVREKYKKQELCFVFHVHGYSKMRVLFNSKTILWFQCVIEDFSFSFSFKAKVFFIHGNQQKLWQHVSVMGHTWFRQIIQTYILNFNACNFQRLLQSKKDISQLNNFCLTEVDVIFCKLKRKYLYIMTCKDFELLTLKFINYYH